MQTPEVFYVFRSGELFLLEDTTLPRRFPDISGAVVLDSLDVNLYGTLASVVLLEGIDSASSVVSSSVSGEGSRLSAGPERGTWIRLREILASDDPALRRLAAPATRALGLGNWHSATRFCGRCGGPLADHSTDCARTCASCGVSVYPRISPCVIVLVTKGSEILLARHTDRNQDVFSCIAGYVEHGETLEECVAREVFEETGLRVGSIRYAGSQGWPYPDQLMVAFTAQWVSGEINVDPIEILEARWFARDKLPNVPRRGTVAWNLIFGNLDTDPA